MSVGVIKRLKGKDERSTRLVYTVLSRGQGHLKLKTRLQQIAQNVTPRSFLLSTFSISLCTRTVQSGFVPHVTFLVQKLLGEMEKCGKEKTPGRPSIFCNSREVCEFDG
jgi:hypothetical protein